MSAVLGTDLIQDRSRRAAEAIADYASLPIERYPHLPLLNRVWELRRNLTAYDAAYITLAEYLEVALFDGGQTAVRHAPDQVELIQ